MQGKRDGGGHPAYVGWSHEGDEAMTRAALAAKLAQAPQALYRIKGLVAAPDSTGWEVQVVGRSIEIKPALDRVARTRLVAIGPQSAIARAQIADWWSQG